jgi:hypothetical protein
MSDDRDPLDELLGSISDGGPVNWDAAERRDTGQVPPRVASLRVVSRIAEFSRGQQRAPRSAAAPQHWGDLLLLERLGAGSHAEVYRAWDPGLQREVALKLIRHEGEGASLLDEGRAAARIRHPHVVAVHGVDHHDGRVGLWMEFIRGSSLEEEVRARGPLDLDAVRRLGNEIGSALEAVHAAGLIHRDVKPANVMRDSAGRHVLADFGLGLRSDEAAARVADPAGTPMYMAPERLAGGAASTRSDVYSLGLLLWFALTGRHPFQADAFAALREAVERGPRPTLRELRRDVPPDLAALVERAIAPDPESRFASAREMVEALAAHGPTAMARKRRPARAMIVAIVAIAAAALAVAALGVWQARRVAPAPPLAAPAATYAVEATFLRRDEGGATRLVTGDRVKTGDRLSLEVRTSRPAWIYVLDEDERGERYLLYPQPQLDAHNPLVADSTFVLPGPVGGKENAWRVSSAGGREYFLVVASPEPVREIEADLGRLPGPRRMDQIAYARIGAATMYRLRGVGEIGTLPPSQARPVAPSSHAFDRFRALAGRETEVRGLWVRQIVLENPRH